MLCEYSPTESESLAQIRTAVAKIQHFRWLFYVIGDAVHHISVF